jgi:hypothetical protein
VGLIENSIRDFYYPSCGTMNDAMKIVRYYTIWPKNARVSPQGPHSVNDFFQRAKLLVSFKRFGKGI